MKTLTDDLILSVNSPKNRCVGPHAVVYKNEDQPWAIVALDWDNEPRLAIRWFNSELGNPTSNEYPTWFVIPRELENAILHGLPLKFPVRNEINRFLVKGISGNELKQKM